DVKSMNRTAGADSDVNASDFVLSEKITPTNAAGETAGSDPDTDPDPDPAQDATIAEVQGTGDVSPVSGEDVVVEGIVTGDYRVGGYKGIAIQSAGSGGETDATPGASDGIFVFLDALTPTLEIGDLVSVTGTVSEYFGQTQISPATAEDINVITAGIGVPAVTPLLETVVGTDREAYENMLVAP